LSKREQTICTIHFTHICHIDESDFDEEGDATSEQFHDDGGFQFTVITRKAAAIAPGVVFLLMKVDYWGRGLFPTTICRMNSYQCVIKFHKYMGWTISFYSKRACKLLCA
jgi:hypothetical protein